MVTPDALRASDETTRRALYDRCYHLFIDEAHHVTAQTWNAIRWGFIGKPVVQFTAIPFREDDKRLGGRIVYSFPLREAQRLGYFSPINYISVVNFYDQDQAIATRVAFTIATVGGWCWPTCHRFHACRIAGSMRATAGALGTGSTPRGTGVWRSCSTGGPRCGPSGWHRGRWVVERTFAWLGRNRRLSQDSDGLSSTEEAWIDRAMIRLVVARSAR